MKNNLKTIEFLEEYQLTKLLINIVEMNKSLMNKMMYRKAYVKCC